MRPCEVNNLFLIRKDIGTTDGILVVFCIEYICSRIIVCPQLYLTTVVFKLFLSVTPNYFFTLRVPPSPQRLMFTYRAGVPP